jgi:hypothetical protein
MKIDVHFSESSQNFTTTMNAKEGQFEADFGQIQAVTQIIGGDPYLGEYVVTPKVEAQTMPTKNKILFDDVEVEPIPYAEVTNNSGGTTATIGGK